MSTFVSALGPGSGLRALSLQPFGPLTSVGLKELFLKTTVLLAFASAKRIENLHAFSVDSDCIRFGPGDCSVTLRPRLEYVPKSLSTPFERTETVRRQPLLLNHRPHRVRTPRLQFARQCFEILHWPFKQFSVIDPAFGCYGGCTKGRAVSKQSLSHWIVDAITEAYTTQGLENPLCTLGAVQRGLSFYLAWSRCMCIQDICLAASGLRRIPSPGFTSWTFSP